MLAKEWSLESPVFVVSGQLAEFLQKVLGGYGAEVDSETWSRVMSLCAPVSALLIAEDRHGRSLHPAALDWVEEDPEGAEIPCPEEGDCSGGTGSAHQVEMLVPWNRGDRSLE